MESTLGKHRIRLPANALPLIALWARRHSGGPLVFSGEIEAVSSSNDRYWPPSTPVGLVDAIFGYDQDHASLVCGASHEDRVLLHPLVAKSPTRDDSLLPYRQHQALLNTPSRESYLYRQLASRYLQPPSCEGGQITLRATAAPGLLPLRLEIESHPYVQTTSWYRKLDVLTEIDSWTASLPYRELKTDIEQRWTVYREAYAGFEELSSIVEALALLHSVYRLQPSIWTTFATELVGPDGELRVADVVPSRLDRFPLLDAGVPERDEQWTALVDRNLTSDANSHEQGDLAIFAAVKGVGELSDYQQLLTVLAGRDKDIRSKWLLAEAVLLMREGELRGAEAKIAEFFRSVSDPADFRLRADGLRLLVTSANDPLIVGDLSRPLARSVIVRLENARIALLRDFVERIPPTCGDITALAAENTLYWERLIEDIYATGLTDILLHDGSLDPGAALAIACAHYRRAMAPHPGADIAFRHAHFRFLQYLMKLRPTDDEIRRRVTRYRNEIASTLGITDWQDNVAAPDTLDLTRPTLPVDSSVTVEGTLVLAHCELSEVAPCDSSTRYDARPIAISTADSWWLLLTEGSYSIPKCGSYPLRARARGVALNHDRTLLPATFELWCDGAWIAHHLPAHEVSNGRTTTPIDARATPRDNAVSSPEQSSLPRTASASNDREVSGILVDPDARSPSANPAGTNATAHS